MISTLCVTVKGCWSRRQIGGPVHPCRLSQSPRPLPRPYFPLSPVFKPAATSFRLAKSLSNGYGQSSLRFSGSFHLRGLTLHRRHPSPTPIRCPQHFLSCLHKICYRLRNKFVERHSSKMIWISLPIFRFIRPFSRLCFKTMRQPLQMWHIQHTKHFRKETKHTYSNNKSPRQDPYE